MPKRPPKQKVELTVPADLGGELASVHVAYENKRGRLVVADVFDVLGSLESASVDLVVTDPPYAIGKAEWDEFPSLESYVEWCDRWLAEVERVLAPDGSAYVCGFSEILAEIKARSAKRFASCRWLIWYYRNKANLGSDWGRSHESILHLRKKTRLKLNVDAVRIPYNSHTVRYPVRVQSTSSQYGQGKRRDRWEPHPLGAKPRDVIELPVLCNGTEEKTPHPTQKPEELIRRFVEGTSSPGGFVVDPFGGSGTTAVVADRADRRWLVSDADPRYVGVARERLLAGADRLADRQADGVGDETL